MKRMRRIKVPSGIVSIILCIAFSGHADHGEQGGELHLATADLAEVDRQLNNPLTSIWSLTF